MLRNVYVPIIYKYSAHGVSKVEVEINSGLSYMLYHVWMSSDPEQSKLRQMPEKGYFEKSTEYVAI